MTWFMDRALARRLERTEGTMCTWFIDARQTSAPEIGAAWQDFDGTYAMYDGLDSPLTQTFGLGLFGPPSPAMLADIEAFYARRGVPTMHEVSPLAGVETLAALVERGYRPIELSTVLVQQVDDATGPPASPALRVRLVDPADSAWAETCAAGWSDDPAVAAIIRPIAERAGANPTIAHFLVERDGAPIATASLGVHEGVALLAGASTIPEARALGAQAVLLAARLAEARRRGCEIAMMVAVPDSTSQRNAERRGFRVAYTRTKWCLRAG